MGGLPIVPYDLQHPDVAVPELKQHGKWSTIDVLSFPCRRSSALDANCRARALNRQNHAAAPHRALLDDGRTRCLTVQSVSIRLHSPNEHVQNFPFSR